MFSRPAIACILGLLACSSSSPDSGDSAGGGTSEPAATDPQGTEADSDDADTAAQAVDLDRDGVSAAQDCDDREPEVYPGAVERWDGLDNDCDGRVDGRGRFEGELALSAVAIVEGQTRRTEVACDVAFDRLAALVRFDVTCPVPPEDELGRQLLGALLVASPVENVAVDGSWQGEVGFDSDAPWTATGGGSGQWSHDLTGIDLALQLETSSLRLAGAGTLVYVGAVP